MRRPLLALALTIVVAGGPALTAMCQVACDSHQADHAAHSSHQHSETAATGGVQTTAVSPDGHRCERPFDDTQAIRQSVQPLNAPAVVVSPVAVQPPADVLVVSRSAVLAERPPGILALGSQLRV
jgi:hypothetical protein